MSATPINHPVQSVEVAHTIPLEERHLYRRQDTLS